MDDDDDGYGGQVRGEETLEIEVEKIGVTQGEDLRRTDTWRRLFLPFFMLGGTYGLLLWGTGYLDKWVKLTPIFANLTHRPKSKK